MGGIQMTSNTAKILTRNDLIKVGEYAKRVGFVVKIMPDNKNASFSLMRFEGMPDICVYYDVSLVRNALITDDAVVSIYWSNGSFDLENTEKFIENMTYARKIAEKLLM